MWTFQSPTAAQRALQSGGTGGVPTLDPSRAAEWRVLAMSSDYERDSGRRGFVLRAGKRWMCVEWVAAGGCWAGQDAYITGKHASIAGDYNHSY